MVIIKRNIIFFHFSLRFGINFQIQFLSISLGILDGVPNKNTVRDPRKFPNGLIYCIDAVSS